MIVITTELFRGPCSADRVPDEPVTRGTTMTDLNVSQDGTVQPDPPVPDPWDSGPDDPPEPPEPPDPPVTDPWDSGPDA
jgi:hypothetical protein